MIGAQKVDVFTPCEASLYAPHTVSNFVELLSAMGVEWRSEGSPACCGRCLYEAGDWSGARALGEELLRSHAGEGLVVCCSSGCAAYMRAGMARLFRGSTHQAASEAFAGRVMDAAAFLVHVARLDTSRLSFPHKVALLDHCRLVPRQEPRRLLSPMGGIELTEPSEAVACCGHGGALPSRFAEGADEMARRRAEAALAAGAEYVVGTDVGCLRHLQIYCQKSGLPLRCVHIVDLLAEAQRHAAPLPSMAANK